jgi:hypothetical protein
MKLLSKKIVLPLAAVALVAAGGLTAAAASADSSGNNPQGSIVQKIADTFHLDKSKVQAVFDENRTERQANQETKYEDRLTQAVTDGQLTASQKDAILTEHNKLASELNAANAKTGAERRTAMNAIRTEAQGWAKSNNINAKWLLGARPLRGMGHGLMMRHDNDADDSGIPVPTASPSVSPSPSA